MREDICSRKITEALNRCREWVNRNAGDYLDQEMKYFNEYISQGHLQAIKGMATSIDLLATYYGNVGIAQVCGDDISGWTEIGRALEYRYWAQRLRYAAIRHGSGLRSVISLPSLELNISDIASLWCAYTSFGQKEKALWMVSFLQQISQRPELHNVKTWKERIYEPFIITLYNEIALGEHTKQSQPASSPYDEVIAHWTDTELLGTSIAECCTYHCKRMIDKGGGKWPAEFDNVPFNLIPFEVAAIFRLRAEQQLPMPGVEHPLLETTLFRTLPDAFTVHDARIDIVKNTFSHFLESE